MYELADRLGMIVDEMLERMSSAELTERMGLDAIRGYERERAERQNKQGMVSRRPRRR